MYITASTDTSAVALQLAREQHPKRYGIFHEQNICTTDGSITTFTLSKYSCPTRNTAYKKMKQNIYRNQHIAIVVTGQ